MRARRSRGPALAAGAAVPLLAASGPPTGRPTPGTPGAVLHASAPRVGVVDCALADLPALAALVARVEPDEVAAGVIWLAL